MRSFGFVLVQRSSLIVCRILTVNLSQDGPTGLKAKIVDVLYSSAGKPLIDASEVTPACPLLQR